MVYCLRLLIGWSQKCGTRVRTPPLPPKLEGDLVRLLAPFAKRLDVQALGFDTSSFRQIRKGARVWFIGSDWKSDGPKGHGGSNPLSSANFHVQGHAK